MGHMEKNSFEMFKIILAVFASFLLLEHVDGKECYECSWTNQGLDNCGEFDSSTPTCTVDDSVSCIKTSAKAAGVKVSNHSGQKNKCTTVGGVKQCCCDGNLCNS